MSAFDRTFVHFVRGLLDLDLTKDFSYKILVERVGFTFFVDIEYEKVLEYCIFCSCIGHGIQNCKRKEHVVKGKDTDGKKLKEGKVNPPNWATTAPPLEVPNEEIVGNNSGSQNDKDHNNTLMGETSDPLQVQTNNNQDTSREDGNSESEYVDATQLVEFVLETQLDEAQQQKVKDFLLYSWDNMAAADKADDYGVDLIQEKIFNW
ncbi:uncharacterized protein LOC131604384 [Vicia villosa]|uniref:uncharacterized protein LOC131604384 n=1 Tax=Vicia villosa TaxID=3911 RepID=UPI00273A8082|nr:uncharacterized protein LOC131604384 [Vicia villosa]